MALHVQAVYLGREAGARAHHQVLVYLLELAAAPRTLRAGSAPLEVGVQLLELLLVLVLGTSTIHHLAAARPLAALERVPRPLLPRSLPLELLPLLPGLAVEAAPEDVLQRVLAAR